MEAGAESSNLGKRSGKGDLMASHDKSKITHISWTVPRVGIHFQRQKSEEVENFKYLGGVIPNTAMQK